MNRIYAAALLVCAFSLLWIGCDNSRSCSVDEDCFSGEVCIDDVCAPEGEGNNGEGSQDAGDDSETSDDGETTDDTSTDDTSTGDTTEDDSGTEDAGPTGPLPVEIASGDKISCARYDNGDVYCWGYNKNNLLNVESSLEELPYPSKVQGLPPAASLDVGHDFACILTDGGDVWCWGENWGFVSGQDNTDEIEPTEAPAGGVIQLEVGQQGGCGLLTGRQDMFCWGRAPDPPTFSQSIRDFDVGDDHACAVLADGNVRCWGDNYYDQSGIDDPIRGMSNASTIFTAVEHTCAMKTDGTVWCWGHNDAGQLGASPDDLEGTAEPVQVEGVAAAVQITAGETYSCARLENGSVKCWGGFEGRDDNTYGAFETKRATLVYPLIADVVDIDGGRTHTCALKSNGEGWCWGNNRSEQLGNDTVDFQEEDPVQVDFQVE